MISLSWETELLLHLCRCLSGLLDCRLSACCLSIGVLLHLTKCAYLWEPVLVIVFKLKVRFGTSLRHLEEEEHHASASRQYD